MKDLSFHSNLEPIAPHVPSAAATNSFQYGIRTNHYGASAGVPFVGSVRTDMPPPASTARYGGAGSGGAVGVGAKGSGVISVNNLGTSNMNMYPMGRTLTNQRTSASSLR